ncbi:MAG: ribonuclease Z [Nanoarchaeota archaeon]|nr:ribonuclease Z [Nanoarchaeota archaeon]
MDIIFLGTSCMVPTKERNHQAIFVSRGTEGLLFDCGEGTQRQFKIAGIKITKITKIFISHWHGDHVLGLPGLLQTLNASDYEGRLEIYGPKGTQKYFESMFSAFSFKIGFEHIIREITAKTQLSFLDFRIDADLLDHSVPCLGYSLTETDRRRIKLPVVKKLGIPEGPLLGELQDGRTIVWKGKEVAPDEVTYIVKGKKVAVILDTVLCNPAVDLAKDADLLICESVYTPDLISKAEEYKHMTTTQAAALANQAGVKKLILTHFSQRYKTGQEVIDEAAPHFSEVVAAFDFMKLKL